MTVLWEFNDKHPKQVSAYGARPLFSDHVRLGEGHPSPFTLVEYRVSVGETEINLCGRKQMDCRLGRSELHAPRPWLSRFAA
jgi:hypothetical protein